MKNLLATLIIFALGITQTISAQQGEPEDAAALAKKLANPIASLISVPFQNNLDVGIGDFNGSRNTLNIQPVIPVTLTAKWNLIARIILPVISQHDIYSEGSDQSGLSDAVVSAFFSPAEAKNGLTWGAGPVMLVPTATDELLGTKKFGVGPTALILKQTNSITFGALMNQIWSVAGAEDRVDVNQMFVQPFFNYNWKSGAGIGVNAEITQNWEGSTTIAYINPIVSGVTKLGKLPLSLVVGPRFQVAAPSGSKSAFGVRTAMIFVFPK